MKGMGGVFLVYPYPWWSERYATKDVELFPRTLAELLGQEYRRILGKCVFGEERETVRAGARRFGLCLNLGWCVAALILDHLASRRLQSETVVVVLFNINYVTAILAKSVRLMTRGRVIVIVKADADVRSSEHRLEASWYTRWLTELSNRSIGRCADIVVAETRASEAVLRREVCGPRASVILCHNGVAVDRGTGRSGKRDIDVLIVSRFGVEKKGRSRYAKLLRELGSEMTILLVGSECEGVLRENTQGSRCRVQCIDRLPHDDLLAVMRRSRVLVNLSHGESYCLTLVEAIECGCRVLSTDVGVAPDLAELGLAVELLSGDVEECARRVTAIVGEADGNEATPWPSLPFDWSSAVSRSDLVRRVSDLAARRGRLA